MTKRMLPAALGALALPALALAACASEPPAEHRGTESSAEATSAVPTPVVPEAEDVAAAPATPLALDLVRNEWATAANRDSCEPLVLTSDGGAPATARRANFSGGWGVAFDTDAVRSAYGVAGPGLTDADKADGQEARLRGQWPYFMALPNLPAPSFGGYGLEGSRAYPADMPDSVGENSLAYVRVAGQACTYNVWSRLGRAHLEVLLQSLRPGSQE